MFEYDDGSGRTSLPLATLFSWDTISAKRLTYGRIDPDLSRGLRDAFRDDKFDIKWVLYDHINPERH